jgi:hypothetical protein
MTRCARRPRFALRDLLFVVPLLTLVSVVPAAAQGREPAHVFVGLSALRDLGGGEIGETDYDRGYLISAATPLPWARLSIVGEVGANSRKNILEETQHLFALMAGARVSLLRTTRLAVFGHVLGGTERFSEPGFAESGPAFQSGAGLDVALWSRVGARLQGDWRLSRQNDVTYKEVRAALGLTFRLGAP